MTVKIIQVPHLARSAMAPEIRATVMIGEHGLEGDEGRVAPVWLEVPPPVFIASSGP